MLKRLLERHRAPHRLPELPSLRQVLATTAGSFLGIAILAGLTRHAGVDLLMAPFGATCVLLFATPGTALAQPRNVIGGHVLASAIGLAAQHLADPHGAIGLAAVVTIAIVAMQLTRTVHAPAGADPLVILLKGHTLGWSFLLTPVLTGAVILVLLAYLVNNARNTEKWPRYWI